MKYKKEVALFVILFLFIISFNYFIQQLTGDEIWSYGFSYNVSNGLIPYRDFNMIVTPLYPYLLGMIIKLFGNHFILLSIFNAGIEVGILLLLYRRIKWKCLIMIPMLLFDMTNAGYNLLCLLLFMIFLEIYESKIIKKDFYLGLVICLIILTKQTVGGVLLIASFFKVKDKKSFLLGFLPVCIMFLFYLLKENAFNEFLNYCLFGMLDFTSNNSFKNNDYYAIIYCIIILSFITTFIKEKNIEFLFIILFQIMAFPIVDIYHILIALIPVLAYFIEKKFYNRKSILILISLVFFSSFYYNLIEITKVSSHIKEIDFMKWKSSKTDFAFIKILNNYIDTNYPDYDLYLFSDVAYLIKMDGKKEINKYDLVNNGNMGYKGVRRYIDEIDVNCSKSKCLIIIDKIEPSGQTNVDIRNYVRRNYHVQEELEGFIILVN